MRSRGVQQARLSICSRSRWIVWVGQCISTTVSPPDSLLPPWVLIIIQSVSRPLARCTICVDLLAQHLLPGFSDITPEIKAKRRIFEIINAVQLNNPGIFAIKPTFDGMKNIFSFKPLFPGGEEGVFSCTPEGAIKEYTVTIRLVAQVESEYLFPSHDSTAISYAVIPRFVKKLISGDPSEAAINMSNILQVVISQHSNM